MPRSRGEGLRVCGRLAGSMDPMAAARAFGEALGEPAWVTAARVDAARHLPPDAVAPAINEVVVDADGHAALRALARRGVQVTSLREALQKDPDSLREMILRDLPRAPTWADRFHGAFWSDGLVVTVPARVALDAAIELPRFTGAALLPRVIVRAGPDSRVHVVDACPSPRPDVTMSASRVLVEVAEGADVHYSAVEQWGPRVRNASTRVAHVAREGSMTWALATVGGATSTTCPITVLGGEGAAVESKVAAFAGAGSEVVVGAHVLGNAGASRVAADIRTVVGPGGAARHVIEGMGPTGADVVSRSLLMGEPVPVPGATVLPVEEAPAYVDALPVHGDAAARLAAVSRHVASVADAMPAVYGVEVARLMEWALAG